MEKSIIEVILQYGGLGAVLCIVGWAYFKKDLSLVALNERLALEHEDVVASAYAKKLR